MCKLVMPFMFNSLFVREDGPFNLLCGSVLNNMVMLYGLHLHLDETSSWPIRPHSDHSSFSMQLHLASTCVFFLYPDTDHMLMPGLNVNRALGCSQGIDRGPSLTFTRYQYCLKYTNFLCTNKLPAVLIRWD